MYSFVVLHILHCPLSGPDLTYISLLIISCIIEYYTHKKDCKELQQTMGKELSEIKDYMRREGACFKVELQQRDRQIETLTTQMRCLSIPANAPKAPPPSPTPTQQNPSSTPPAPTKSSHPSNSQREAETPATPRNPSEKLYSYKPS